jgi:hypothetical protein
MFCMFLSLTYFRSTGLCNGLATYSAPTGNLRSGPTGQQYSNNMACQFLIQPLGAESISIYFSSFTTESSLDVVRLILPYEPSGCVAHGVTRSACMQARRRPARWSPPCRDL